MNLSSESHTFDWNPDYPLLTTAKRYWLPDKESREGYTLILTHGIGFTKEQWGPTLNALFTLSLRPGTSFRIREAWSIDCPNHGHAAILNDDLLVRGAYSTYVFSWEEYIKVIYRFLMLNPHTDFKNHKLVGIGHSMGATCLSLTLTHVNPPHFEALILCEPMLGPTDLPPDSQVFAKPEAIDGFTLKRKDIWPSREAAKSALTSKRAFQIWDKGVLEVYFEHGFRDLPTALYPDIKEGVTLSCTKFQEAATYRDRVTSRRGYEFLPTLYNRVPVHIIWGEQVDILALEVKERVSHAKYGRKPASISIVKGAGHLIVQTSPVGLAEAIYGALNGRTGVIAGKL